MAFLPHVQAARPEIRAFLDDIREHPEDDAPRLILADWLDDFGCPSGRARAEFIRIQCQLARPGVAPRGLSARLRFLLHHHAADWLGPLAGLADGWRFERGMVHLAFRGHQLFNPRLIEMLRTETYAWVEGVVLRELPGGAVNVLEQQPLLAGVLYLTLEESQPTQLGLVRLVECPHLRAVRELHLAMNHVGPAMVEALCRSPRMRGLTALDLVRNPVGDRGVAALAGSAHLPNLRRLRLAYTDLSDRALRALAASSSLGSLRELDLGGNRRCGGEGLAELLGSPLAAGLRCLDLGSLPLSPEAVATLAGSARLGNLERLRLDRTNVGDRGLKTLAAGPGLPALRHLSAGRVRLGDAGVTAWANFSTRRLRVLDLPHNHLGPDSAEALAGCECLSGLQELSLEDNALGDAGAAALAGPSRFEQLQFLDVGSNGLSPGAKAKVLRRFGPAVALV